MIHWETNNAFSLIKVLIDFKNLDPKSFCLAIAFLATGTESHVYLTIEF